MMATKRSPSIADVAALAGVSHQTVSRVLNDHPNVREQTRVRVRAAITELGYRPNEAARTLARGQGNSIGVIVPTSFGPDADPSAQAVASELFGPATMRFTIEELAATFGFSANVTSVRMFDQASLLAAVHQHLQHRVRGIVIIAQSKAAYQAIDAIPPGFPFIIVDGDRSLAAPTVSVDQELGAELATQHLLDAGHRTVWHVSGIRDSFDGRDRANAWRRTLEKAGAEVPPIMDGDWTAQSGFAAGQLLALIPEITAIFAGNDQMALGVISALSRHGLSVPRDVSIVGFDDIPEAGYFIPPLTTVRQDFAEVARRAVSALIAQIEDTGTSDVSIFVEPKLIPRESVAPPSR